MPLWMTSVGFGSATRARVRAWAVLVAPMPVWRRVAWGGRRWRKVDSMGVAARMRMVGVALIGTDPSQARDDGGAHRDDGGAGSQQAPLDGQDGGLRAVVGAELVQERRDVELGSALSDRQLARDLLIGAAVGDQAQHLAL